MDLTDLLIYIFSFVLIWVGSGLTVKSISQIAVHLNFPKFIVSFIILGTFTNLPEIFLAFKSTSEGTPEISAGNLIGGTPVMLFFLVPLLALLSGGIRLSHEMNPVRLFLTVFVTSLPFLFLLDGQSTTTEGVIMLCSYFILVTVVKSSETSHPLFYKMRVDMVQTVKNEMKVLLYLPVLAAGIGLIFISSNLIVEKTLNLAELLQISPFVISLVVLSIGTSLPEVAIGIRSVIMKEKDVAIGGYLGSAITNTWIFAVLTFANNGELKVTSGSLFSSIVFVLGLIVFFYFANSKRFLSRKESLILLGIFLIFGLDQML